MDSTMIKLQRKLPRKLFLGVSGGVDSIAAFNFLSNNHDVTPVFINHGTPTSHEAEQFLWEQYGAKVMFCRIENVIPPKNTSTEEHWRNERYKIFHSLDGLVATYHHLDDCVETWIWSSLNGNSKIIPYRNMNVIRPFRLTTKNDFVEWCTRKNVKWIDDKSNVDLKYIRNYIRAEIVPRALIVNPGLHKVVARKVRDDQEVDVDWCTDGVTDGRIGQDSVLP